MIFMLFLCLKKWIGLPTDPKKYWDVSGNKTFFFFFFFGHNKNCLKAWSIWSNKFPFEQDIDNPSFCIKQDVFCGARVSILSGSHILFCIGCISAKRCLKMVTQSLQTVVAVTLGTQEQYCCRIYSNKRSVVAVTLGTQEQYCCRVYSNKPPLLQLHWGHKSSTAAVFILISAPLLQLHWGHKSSTAAIFILISAPGVLQWRSWDNMLVKYTNSNALKPILGSIWLSFAYKKVGGVFIREGGCLLERGR